MFGSRALMRAYPIYYRFFCIKTKESKCTSSNNTAAKKLYSKIKTQ